MMAPALEHIKCHWLISSVSCDNDFVWLDWIASGEDVRCRRSFQHHEQRRKNQLQKADSIEHDFFNIKKQTEAVSKNTAANTHTHITRKACFAS